MSSFVMASGSGLLTGVPGINNDFKIYGIRSKTKKELYVYIAGPNGGCIPLRFEGKLIILIFNKQQKKEYNLLN